MGFLEDVKTHMDNEYPETRLPIIPKKKTFAIHIPEQTFYTTANTFEEAEQIASDEYANLYDEIKEIDTK